MFVLGCLAAWPVRAAPSPEAANPPATRLARDAAMTIHGILGFASWPGDPHRIRLCVVGRTRYGNALPQGDRNHRHRVTVVHGLPADTRACEAIYLGDLPRWQWEALQRRIAGRPVLTIGDRPEACYRGDMFCLDPPPGGGTGFDVNLPALARSGVRVRPGVLELARQQVRSQ